MNGTWSGPKISCAIPMPILKYQNIAKLDKKHHVSASLYQAFSVSEIYVLQRSHEIPKEENT